MIGILRFQLNVLIELAELLKNEKKFLIQLNYFSLIDVIERKKKIIAKIEDNEVHRKNKYDDVSFKKFIITNQEGQKLVSQIKNLMNEISELQNINMMLTNQSLVYDKKLMEIIRNSLSKGPIIYSGTGSIRKSNLSVQSAFNQTV